MPIENLGRKHPTAADMQAIDQAIDNVYNLLAAYTLNLSSEERQRYGSINEQNKLFANKVRDLAQVSPELRSPDVDWNEFEADYQTRYFCDTRLMRLQQLTRTLSDLKIAHDYDNYQDALMDYDYTKYKSGTHAIGFTEKNSTLAQFFQRSAPKASDNTTTTDL